jgi:hypothetical protein
MRAGRGVSVALAALAMTTWWAVAPAGAATTHYGFTGQPVNITVPQGVCGYDIQIVGGNGGDTPKADGSGMSGRGGDAGRIGGRIGVEPGDTIRIDIGGAGQDGDKGGAGGFNFGAQGGSGGTQTGSTGITTTHGAGGGGGTFVRVNTQSFFVLVAVGGGGAGGPEPTTTHGGRGGAGGFVTLGTGDGNAGSDSSPVGGKPGQGGKETNVGAGGAASTSNTGASAGANGTVPGGAAVATRTVPAPS